MKVYGAVVIWIHVLLASALVEVSGQFHAPATVPPGEEPLVTAG
jgi:hypothetical protein